MNFKELSVEQLVEFINKELKKDENASVNKLSEKMDIKRSTLKAKLNRAGYMYNSEKRLYEKKDSSIKKDIIQKQNKSKTSLIKDNTLDENEIIKKEKDDSSMKREVIQKQNESKINLTEDDILKLKEILEKKEEIFLLLNKSKEVKAEEKNKLEIDRAIFSDEVTNRVIKIYADINKEWMNFCNNYKQYKMQDLYSLALKEFIEKYK